MRFNNNSKYRKTDTITNRIPRQAHSVDELTEFTRDVCNAHENVCLKTYATSNWEYDLFWGPPYPDGDSCLGSQTLLQIDIKTQTQTWLYYIGAVLTISYQTPVNVH